MSRLVMVGSCCWCIHLRVGSFLIAFIDMICTALMLAFLTLILMEQQEKLATLNEQWREYSDTKTVIVFVIIGLVLLVQNFGFCCILFYGLIVKNRGCLLGFRMFTGFMIFLCTISLIPCFINGITLYLGIFAAFILVLSVCYLIVHSYFKQLGGYSAEDSDWGGCLEDCFVKTACLCARACIRAA